MEDVEVADAHQGLAAAENSAQAAGGDARHSYSWCDQLLPLLPANCPALSTATDAAAADPEFRTWLHVGLFLLLHADVILARVRRWSEDHSRHTTRSHGSGTAVDRVLFQCVQFVKQPSEWPEHDYASTIVYFVKRLFSFQLRDPCSAGSESRDRIISALLTRCGIEAANLVHKELETSRIRRSKRKLKHSKVPATFRSQCAQQLLALALEPGFRGYLVSDPYRGSEVRGDEQVRQACNKAAFNNLLSSLVSREYGADAGPDHVIHGIAAALVFCSTNQHIRLGEGVPDASPGDCDDDWDFPMRDVNNVTPNMSRADSPTDDSSRHPQAHSSDEVEDEEDEEDEEDDDEDMESQVMMFKAMCSTLQAADLSVRDLCHNHASLQPNVSRALVNMVSGHFEQDDFSNLLLDILLERCEDGSINFNDSNDSSRLLPVLCECVEEFVADAEKIFTARSCSPQLQKIWRFVRDFLDVQQLSGEVVQDLITILNTYTCYETHRRRILLRLKELHVAAKIVITAPDIFKQRCAKYLRTRKEVDMSRLKEAMPEMLTRMLTASATSASQLCLYESCPNPAIIYCTECPEHYFCQKCDIVVHNRFMRHLRRSAHDNRFLHPIETIMWVSADESPVECPNASSDESNHHFPQQSEHVDEQLGTPDSSAEVLAPDSPGAARDQRSPHPVQVFPSPMDVDDAVESNGIPPDSDEPAIAAANGGKVLKVVRFRDTSEFSHVFRYLNDARICLFCKRNMNPKCKSTTGKQTYVKFVDAYGARLLDAVDLVCPRCDDTLVHSCDSKSYISREVHPAAPSRSNTIFSSFFLQALNELRTHDPSISFETLARWCSREHGGSQVCKRTMERAMGSLGLCVRLLEQACGVDPTLCPLCGKNPRAIHGDCVLKFYHFLSKSSYTDTPFDALISFFQNDWLRVLKDPALAAVSQDKRQRGGTAARVGSEDHEDDVVARAHAVNTSNTHPGESVELCGATRDFRANRGDHAALDGKRDRAGIFVGVCPHQYIKFFLDMETHESMSVHAVAFLLCRSLSSRMVACDIGCHNLRTFLARFMKALDKVNADTRTFLDKVLDKVEPVLLLSLLHSYAHLVPCRWLYATRMLQGAGLFTGEEGERVFSQFNSLAPLTHSASLQGRRDLIDNYAASSNQAKFRLIPVTLYDRLKGLLKTLAEEHVKLLDGLRKAHEEYPNDFASFLLPPAPSPSSPPSTSLPSSPHHQASQQSPANSEPPPTLDQQWALILFQWLKEVIQCAEYDQCLRKGFRGATLTKQSIPKLKYTLDSIFEAFHCRPGDSEHLDQAAAAVSDVLRGRGRGRGRGGRGRGRGRGRGSSIGSHISSTVSSPRRPAPAAAASATISLLRTITNLLGLDLDTEWASACARFADESHISAGISSNDEDDAQILQTIVRAAEESDNASILQAPVSGLPSSVPDVSQALQPGATPTEIFEIPDDDQAQLLEQIVINIPDAHGPDLDFYGPLTRFHRKSVEWLIEHCERTISRTLVPLLHEALDNDRWQNQRANLRGAPNHVGDSFRWLADKMRHRMQLHDIAIRADGYIEAQVQQPLIDYLAYNAENDMALKTIYLELVHLCSFHYTLILRPHDISSGSRRVAATSASMTVGAAFPPTSAQRRMFDPSPAATSAPTPDALRDVLQDDPRLHFFVAHLVSYVLCCLTDAIQLGFAAAAQVTSQKNWSESSTARKKTNLTISGRFREQCREFIEAYNATLDGYNRLIAEHNYSLPDFHKYSTADAGDPHYVPLMFARAQPGRVPMGTKVAAVWSWVNIVRTMEEYEYVKRDAVNFLAHVANSHDYLQRRMTLAENTAVLAEHQDDNAAAIRELIDALQNEANMPNLIDCSDAGVREALCWLWSCKRQDLQDALPESHMKLVRLIADLPSVKALHPGAVFGVVVRHGSWQIHDVPANLLHVPQTVDNTYRMWLHEPDVELLASVRPYLNHLLRSLTEEQDEDVEADVASRSRSNRSQTNACVCARYRRSDSETTRTPVQRTLQSMSRSAAGNVSHDADGNEQIEVVSIIEYCPQHSFYATRYADQVVRLCVRDDFKEHRNGRVYYTRALLEFESRQTADQELREHEMAQQTDGVIRALRNMHRVASADTAGVADTVGVADVAGNAGARRSKRARTLSFRLSD